MKLGKPFIIIIVALFVMVLVVDAFMPHKFDWDAQFSSESVEPLNSQLFDDVMRQSMPGRYTVTARTFAEWDRADSACKSFLLVKDGYYMDSTDYVHIMNLLDKGNNVLIASTGRVLDTLECYIGSSMYVSSYIRNKNTNDSIQLIWSGHGFKNDKFKIKKIMSGSDIIVYSRQWETLLYREKKDKEEDDIPAFVYGASDEEYEMPAPEEYVDSDYYEPDRFYSKPKIVQPEGLVPLAVMRKYGKGKLIIVGDPFLFSNYAMRHDAMTVPAMRILSQIAELPIVRIDETLVKTNAQGVAVENEHSKFRVFLSNPPLRWALYLAFFTVILSLFFTARRRQRVIPVIKRPVNYTMAMIKHIGTLYYQRRDHKDLVEKKYLYFADELRRHAMVDIDDDDHLDSEIDALSARTGIDSVSLKNTVLEIKNIVFYADEIDVHTMQNTVDKMNDIISKL